jgi:hypothetical protein
MHALKSAPGCIHRRQACGLRGNDGASCRLRLQFIVALAFGCWLRLQFIALAFGCIIFSQE